MAALLSQTMSTRDSGLRWKFRTIFGPQYPYPMTPILSIFVSLWFGDNSELKVLLLGRCQRFRSSAVNTPGCSGPIVLTCVTSHTEGGSDARRHRCL